VPLDFWDGASFGFWGERAAWLEAEQQEAKLADPLDAFSEEHLAAMDGEPGAYSRAQLVALDIEWLANVPEWLVAEARLEKERKRQFILLNGRPGHTSVGVPDRIRHARGYVKHSSAAGGTGGSGTGGSGGEKGGKGGKGSGKGGGAEGGGQDTSQHLAGNLLSISAHLGSLEPVHASALTANAHVDVPDLSQGTPPYVLPPDSPDARYPWKLRWDRWQWLTVELYDKWLRGGTLEADDFPEEDAFLIEQGEPQSEAARVTWLINRVPRSLAWLGGDMDIDASRPAASQLDAFVRMGWPTPPTAGELVRRMVDGVKANYGRHRPLPGKEVYVNSQRDYLLKADRGNGGEGGDTLAAVAAASDDTSDDDYADYDAYGGDAWDDDAERRDEDERAAYAAPAGVGGA